MTKTELAKEITKYIYDYIRDADCSCSYDYFGTCWYHMSDEERINFLAQRIERTLENNDFSS